MRMAHTFTGRRSLATDVTSKSHKGSILPDSVRESNTANPLQYLKGVGPARVEILSRMGIRSPMDLATYYPSDWEDRRIRFSIQEAPMGEKTALRGKIVSVEFATTRSQLGIATAVLEDPTGRLSAVWFKKLTPRYDVFSALRRNLQPGKSIYVFGTLEWGSDGRQIHVEDLSVLPDGATTLAGDELFHFERLVPVYTVPQDFSERLLRTLIGRVLLNQKLTIRDLIPESVRRKKNWKNRFWALSHIHFPTTLVQKEEARELLAFEEFLILETALARIRQRFKEQNKSQPYVLRRHLLTPFREHLGFEFTPPQKRVIRELFDDLMKPEPMNRLLQGDVGSGKTIVALSAMLLAVENGGQAALMARHVERASYAVSEKESSGGYRRGARGYRHRNACAHPETSPFS
jgi:ATP-dependent DNA helicase RecG